MSSNLTINSAMPNLDAAQTSVSRGQDRAKVIEEVRADPVSQNAGDGGALAQPDPSAVLDHAARQAAQDLYRGRDVQVTGTYDESSGRMVYRVSDKNSGELLAQSPSETLLRFYASGRAEQDGNLIAIEA